MCSSDLIHHAYTASLAWGTDKDDITCFVGVECPHSPGGCITQMLKWIDQNSAFAFDTYKSRPSFGKYEVHLYFFNGSKFDNYLLLKSLQYNDYRPQVIMQDNSILTISYSNVIVKDLIRLYPGSNLAGCFKVFKTKPFHGAKVPSADKWECFPYKLISRMLTESFSIDYLRSHPDVWGGKFADYDSHGDVPTYQTACDTNCDWWLRHVGNTAGYNELVRYCNDDTQILLYCAIIHQMVIAQGVINERPFNLTKCYTIASSSLHLFQQCFLEQPIASNANEFKSGLFFENGEEVSVSYRSEEHTSELQSLAYRMPSSA